jgi:hypothetical protein
MQVCILLEDRLKPMPQNIEVIFDAGPLEIVINNDINNRITGDHVILEGSEQAFKTWLKPFDGVYLGIGAMQAQQFQIYHVKG